MSLRKRAPTQKWWSKDHVLNTECHVTLLLGAVGGV